MTASPTAAEGKRRSEFAARLRERRLERNLSINELARKANIAKSNLARLEAGDGNPSLETLWALSVALSINVRDLIDPEIAKPRLHRASLKPDTFAETAQFGVGLLSSCPVGAVRDLYYATLQPGTAKISEPHPVGTVEHIIIVTGRALVGPVGSEEILEPGDYLTFPASQQHVYQALHPDTTALVIMETS